MSLLERAQADLCLGRHRDGRDRRALDGRYLCGGCRDHLEQLIAEMSALHAELGHVLAGGSSEGGQRVSGSSSEPLPINPAAADHRHQIAHDLVWWCVYVAQARGIATPASSEPTTTATWLTVHVDWLAANRPAAEECLPVMRQLAGRARALIDPDRRLPTGERCRTTDEETGERCDGAIVFVQGSDDLWQARCPECGKQEAADYLHDGITGRWVTIERVEAYVLRVHGQRVARATVRSWVAREHIQGKEERGKTWYDLGSIERYLTERRRMSA